MTGPHKNETRCECEHNTIGVDCEMCHPSFNDAPWRSAGAYDGHACKGCSVVCICSCSYVAFFFFESYSACFCNGFAKTCNFSRELYERTGHGSVCIDCTGNRGGANCESCRPGYYRLPESEGECLPCGCDPIGQLSCL